VKLGKRTAYSYELGSMSFEFWV